MAQVEEGGDREKSHISMPASNFPRDLLPRFVSVNHFPVKLEEPASEDADADAEDVELSLGLSLNGRFGVDPRAKTKKIKRTSSIPEFAKQVRDEDDVASYAMPMACAPLMRACSLPTETEEEWRKRKELQTLRRMEARRKRSEKQRNLKALRERNRALSEDIDVADNYNYKRAEEGVEGPATLDEFTPRARGLPLPPSSSKPQGSIASQGISQSECQTAHQGTLSVDSASLTGSNRLPNERKLPVTSGTRNAENSDKIGAVTMRNQSSRLASPADRTAKDGGGGSRNLLEDMPSVSTKGEGPNGKRIEGFLYRYRKGEEVRIVCVCHGSFLSPAEFVKHAGGGDVAHPLKHIVVNPSML